MTSGVTLASICVASENVVVRSIEGEIIIVPLIAGIGDADDELYSLNEAGQAIWDKLDGRRTLAEVVDLLANEYTVSPAELQADVLGFIGELTRRRILVTR